jgi:colicin import membrane protein
MDDEKHYPPGSEADKAQAEEAAKAEAETKAAADKAAEEAKAKEDADAKAKADADATAAAEADTKAKAEEEARAKDPNYKKRSIYDDYKDKKDEAKAEKARADAAEAKSAELQALLDKKDDAKTPKEKSKADDDLAAFAEAQKLDPEALTELIGIISKRLPKAELPADLDDKLKVINDFQAREKQRAEDESILAEAPKVKTALDIHDDAELATGKVRAGYVATKLAHLSVFDLYAFKRQLEDYTSRGNSFSRGFFGSLKVRSTDV